MGMSVRFPARRACALMVLAALTTEPALARDSRPDTWEATDGLGRELPTQRDVGDPNGRKVFIFYYIWQQRSADPEPYDISKIIAGKTQPWSDAPWGPSPAFHWWSEPALGYYDINDEFVQRRHAQMLADAGVDAIVIDVTNGLTYDSTWQKLCSTYQSLRAAGNRTPNIAFIAHASSDATVQHLYERLYAENACAGLWQEWLGKPLFLALPGPGLSDAAKSFFTFRESWAWSDPNGWFGSGQDKWPWLDNAPQHFGWHLDASEPEEMPVGVAQHPISNYGRSYHAGAEPRLDANSLAPTTPEGIGFQEQWETALRQKPAVAFVTQWNEWIAQRFVTCGTYDTGAANFLGHPLACGDTHFIDEFNPEFSRDAEPMRGGFGDAYYYQLVSNIRRFKGARATAAASSPRTIAAGDFRAFDDVQPEYLDDVGDVTHRQAPGYAGPKIYSNSSGRNDLVLARVARDVSTLYFYVQAASQLSPASGSTWMTLWLDQDADARTGFLGFDYKINGNRSGGKPSIQRYDAASSSWVESGVAELALAANELIVSVPRALVKMKSSNGPLTFRFKWSDNLPEMPHASDFIDQGDVAPNGRFTYCYLAAEDIPTVATGGGSGGEAGMALGTLGGAPSSAAGSSGAGGYPEQPPAQAGANDIAGNAHAGDASMSGTAHGCSCELRSQRSSRTFGACLCAMFVACGLRRRRTRSVSERDHLTS